MVSGGQIRLSKRSGNENNPTSSGRGVGEMVIRFSSVRVATPAFQRLRQAFPPQRLRLILLLRRRSPRRCRLAIGAEPCVVADPSALEAPVGFLLRVALGSAADAGDSCCLTASLVSLLAVADCDCQ